jgi:hypothetical protein
MEAMMVFERQKINDVIQLGRESVEGVATPATKRLAALNFMIGPSIETKQMKAAGSRAHSVNMLNKYWADVTLEESPCTYDELPTAISMALGAPVITTPGGGTNSRNHIWTPPNSTPMTPVPFTIESGSFVRADRAAGVRLSALAMEFSRENGVTVTGAGMGQTYTDNVQLTKNATYTLTADATPPTAGTFTLTHAGNTTAGIAFGATPAQVQTALEALASIGAGQVVVSLTTAGPTLATAATVYTIEFRGLLATQAVTLTGTFTGLTASGSIALAAGVVGATPTSDPIIPIQGTQISVYSDTTAAGLGSTQLLRPLSGGFDISDLYGPLWVLNRSLPGYAANVETDPSDNLTATLVLEADAAGMSPLAGVATGDKLFLRFEAVGPVIEAAITYRLWADLCVAVTDASKGEDQGVDTMEYTFIVMYDVTWQKFMEIQMRNTLQSIT